MKKKICILFLLLIFCQMAEAKRLYKECVYQKAWCDKNGGVLEFRNPDNTRVDCLTEDYAIEFDFVDKWAESVGQALYYSLLTQRKPAIVLISENGEKDRPYIERAKRLAGAYNVKVFLITEKDTF